MILVFHSIADENDFNVVYQNRKYGAPKDRFDIISGLSCIRCRKCCVIFARAICEISKQLFNVGSGYDNRTRSSSTDTESGSRLEKCILLHLTKAVIKE